MARQERSTTFAQESTRPITQVALYARVSTVNNQDPEMQPSGRLMFQIIGAMAEFERSLIQERVRAGLRNARNKGKKLGRPRVTVDASKIASLRSQGRSWAEIVAEMGIGKGTAQRALAGLPKIR